MSLKRALVTLVLVGFASAPALVRAADSFAGTWKLNTAKSTSTYKSGTSVSETTADSLKVTVDLVAADGTAYHWSWTAKYDGKDYPVTGKTPYGDKGTVALTKVDDHTLKLVAKADGKVVANQDITTSADGKTRTVKTKGTDKAGKPIDTVSVYDRQ